MGLRVPLDRGRTAFLESVDSFLRAVDGFSEYELFGASRCHGWSRLEVVGHVLAGWQEMLAGLVSEVGDEPTVDAATYWQAFAADFGDLDPVDLLTMQRRRTAAYARPNSAVAQLHDVADAVRRGAESLADGRFRWQGHVFTAGDYLAIWAVEDVVHELDLLAEQAPPGSALGLTRATIEALVGATLPEAWTDDEAVLIGTGRLPVPEGTGPLAEQLPALG